MSLPLSFVWSRFGTEAGQTIDSILQRKEQERLANEGTFYWGIGNAVGPSISALVSHADGPEVLFSPIKSPARTVDAYPDRVVTWTAAIGLNGKPYTLPQRSLITSRFTVGQRHHYALVCSSDSALTDTQNMTSESLFTTDLCNLLTGRPLGASQVTAVVKWRPQPSASGATYPVSFRARLIPPYFIRLSMPRPISREALKAWALDFLVDYPKTVRA